LPLQAAGQTTLILKKNVVASIRSSLVSLIV
jgi:hypothetical protein